MIAVQEHWGKGKNTANTDMRKKKASHYRVKFMLKISEDDVL